MADVPLRVLRLLTVLQSGHRFTGAELGDRLGISTRSVRRDVERLRAYGYRIETQPGPGGHYRLVPGRALPPLVLDDEEAVATLAALAVLAATDRGEGSLGHAAARAYARIEQFLPRRLRRRVTALRQGIETDPVHAPATSAGVLAELAEAIQARRVVSFGYDRSGGLVDRTVEPHRLVHRHLAWYLIAWDRDRADWRTFRLDRVSGLQVTPGRFTRRPLPQESGADYLARGVHRHDRQVVLTVHAPYDDVAAALAYRDARLTPVTGSVTRVQMHLDDWRWLVLTLTQLDAEAIIEEPAEFALAAAQFAQRLSRSSPPADHAERTSPAPGARGKAPRRR